MFDECQYVDVALLVLFVNPEVVLRTVVRDDVVVVVLAKRVELLVVGAVLLLRYDEVVYSTGVVLL